VLNHGNGRSEVFHKDADFDAFINLFAGANDRLPNFAVIFSGFPSAQL